VAIPNTADDLITLRTKANFFARVASFESPRAGFSLLRQDDRKHEGRLAVSITLVLRRCSAPSPFDSADETPVVPIVGRMAEDRTGK
jgi:hypothetical protein